MSTSLVLTPHNQQFVTTQVQRTGVTKTKIINTALDLYRKYVIAADLEASFSHQSDEEIAEVMSDFEDYLRIVDRNE